MSDLILVYITCKDDQEAISIGKQLLKKKLCGCINIFSNMQSICFWPSDSNKLEQNTETVLLAKTLKSHFISLEKEVLKIHSYDVPCIIAMEASNVSLGYEGWIKEALK